MAKEFFSRHEIKYLIPFSRYEQLVEELLVHMKYDSSGDAEGKYNIISLYFESPDFRIYYETVNKLRFRQKLRLRVYNQATEQSEAFFEIKQKFKKVVHKRRTRILLRDAYHYIENVKQTDLESYSVSNPQIMNEIDSFKNLYELQPNVIVSYDRQAFQGIDDDDLRVTFDYNLKCRSDDLRVEHGPYGDLFVDQDLVILEVKVTHSVPLWLSRLLSEFECPKKSVSKFCTSLNCCNLAPVKLPTL